MNTNELKATDLMIGDWVMLQGKPYMIDMLNGYQESSMGVEPIPLTPEILEKNGFELKSESPYSQYFAIDFDDVDIDYLVVELHPKSNYVRVNYQTEKRDVHLSCSFVGGCHLHELQHLLKLCKINFEFVV